jgi:hypothetical protein
MTHSRQKFVRILAIAPSTRGFGFAVLEQGKLVDWGVKSVKGDKNLASLVRVEKMIHLYNPSVLVLQNCSDVSVRRSTRIQILAQRILELAAGQKLRVKLLTNEQVKRIVFGNGLGTKHALAEILAQRFPDELGHRLPPKRRPWMSEDYRMDIFDAVALAVAVSAS